MQTKWHWITEHWLSFPNHPILFLSTRLLIIWAPHSRSRLASANATLCPLPRSPPFLFSPNWADILSDNLQPRMKKLVWVPPSWVTWNKHKIRAGDFLHHFYILRMHVSYGHHLYWLCNMRIWIGWWTMFFSLVLKGSIGNERFPIMSVDIRLRGSQGCAYYRGHCGPLINEKPESISQRYQQFWRLISKYSMDIYDNGITVYFWRQVQADGRILKPGIYCLLSTTCS